MPKPGEKPKDQPEHPDAEILKGGPAETALEAPAKETPSPRLVSVKYGGKDIQVPEDVAQAWESREREFGQKLSEHSQELGELRKFRTSVQQTVQPQTPQRPDLSTLMFENPAEYNRLMREEIKAEIRQEYTQDQGLRDFWRSFYRKHDDLDGEDSLVQAVMQRHWGELQTLPVSSAQDKIADLTRGEILRISKKLKGGNTEEELPQGRAVVEGASRPVSRTRKTEEDEGKPKTLSEVIRDRRQARLAPKQPAQKG